MEAGTKTLAGVLGSAWRFIIPEYQRPYVWTREEVEQLWNDLSGAFEDLSSRDTDSDEDTYFLGPVVVANQKDVTTGAIISNVVDGQQRLTTLHSLLWILHGSVKRMTSDEANEMVPDLYHLLALGNGKSRLQVAGLDQSVYQGIREGTILDETCPLGVAAKFLRDKVAQLPEQQLLRFCNCVMHRTRFILVQTDSYASAWELFIGLNGKGRPLSPADLIKAYVCGNSVDSRSTADIWDKSVLPLGGDSTSAILDTSRVATGEAGSDATLFKIFERAWKNQEIGATLLSQGCQAYYRFWLHPLENLRDLRSDVKRSIRCLRSLRRRDVTSILIAIASRFGFDAVFEPKFVRVLDAYQLWMAISGRRGREAKFAKLAHDVYKSEWDLSRAYQEIRTLIESLRPNDEQVMGCVRSAAYRGRVMLLIVKSYEEGMRGDVQIDDVWYEHIMPQTGTEFWYDVAGTRDQNAYARIVNNIGNIAPLDFATNIKGSNDDWPVKRALFMAEVPNWLVANLARDNEDGWTHEKIARRADDIAQWAVKTRWNLTEALAAL